MSVRMLLRAPVGCRIDASADEAVALVLNDDPAAISTVHITAPPAAALEEGEDPGVVTLFNFGVSRGNGTSGACSVSWRLDSASTVDAGDLEVNQPTSGTVTWAAGDGTAKTIAIGVRGDLVVENDETIVVTLENPVNCTILAATATATVLDDDVEPAPRAIIVPLAPPDLFEGGTGQRKMTFTLRRTNSSVGACSVDWLMSGTVDPATDLVPDQPTSGTVSWADGETTSKGIDVFVAGDQQWEEDETVEIILVSSENCEIGTESVSARILNDDAAPLSEISLAAPAAAEEGPSGSIRHFVFTLTRSSPAAGDCSIEWRIPALAPAEVVIAAEQGRVDEGD
jgi:hypothetical protein